MTDDAIGRLIAERLLALSRDDRTADEAFAALAAVNAALDPDAGVDPTPENAGKAFDLCLKGAESCLRLAVIYARVEDELIRRGHKNRE